MLFLEQSAATRVVEVEAAAKEMEVRQQAAKSGSSKRSELRVKVRKPSSEVRHRAEERELQLLEEQFVHWSVVSVRRWALCVNPCNSRDRLCSMSLQRMPLVPTCRKSLRLGSQVARMLQRWCQSIQHAPPLDQADADGLHVGWPRSDGRKGHVRHWEHHEWIWYEYDMTFFFLAVYYGYIRLHVAFEVERGRSSFRHATPEPGDATAGALQRRYRSEACRLHGVTRKVSKILSVWRLK